MVQDQLTCPLTKGERILVAIDGSEYSEAILTQAISMGKICNSVIFAISVVELFSEQMALAPALEEKMSKETRETLDKAQNRVQEADITCETIVHFGGLPHKFIVSEAVEKNIDLIVIGTHGRGRLKEVFMGGVAQRVIANAPCPVLVIPV
jgi:nucleotide-binding universal stress UspA family protein